MCENGSAVGKRLRAGAVQDAGAKPSLPRARNVLDRWAWGVPRTNSRIELVNQRLSPAMILSSCSNRFSPGERTKAPRPQVRDRVAEGRVRVEGGNRLLRVRAGVSHVHFCFGFLGSIHGLLPRIGTMNRPKNRSAGFPACGFTGLSSPVFPALWGGRGNTDMLVGLGSSWARGRTRMSALRFKERAHTAFPQTKALHRPDHGQP